MKRTHILAVAACAACLILFTASLASAQVIIPKLLAPYDHLLVVKGQGGTIWKKFCSRACIPACTPSCEAWTQVPGLTDQPPLVLWDKSKQLYYVYVVNAAGATYRSTFTRDGVWGGAWTQLDGIVTAPVGGAGGDIISPQVFSTSSNSAVAVGSTCTNYLSVTFTPVASGKAMVTAEALFCFNHVGGVLDRVEIHLGETATDCAVPDQFVSVGRYEETLPTDTTACMPIHASRTFNVSEDVEKTIYFNMRMTNGSGNSDVIDRGNMSVILFQ